MTVALTLTKTIAGSAVADSLDGGTSGYDLQQGEVGDATPPEFALFIKHDGSANIRDLALNVQEYTGTYGGDYSASADLTKLLAHGDAAAGFEFEFTWNAGTTFSSPTRITTGSGDNFINRIQIPATAMSYNNAGTEQDASAPVDGRIGAIGDSTLGDRAHIIMRYSVPAGETENGTRQWGTYFSYNFTT